MKKLAEALKKEIESRLKEIAPLEEKVRMGINGLTNLMNQQGKGGGWFSQPKKVDTTQSIQTLTSSCMQLAQQDPNNTRIFEADELIRKAKATQVGEK